MPETNPDAAVGKAEKPVVSSPFVGDSNFDNFPFSPSPAGKFTLHLESPLTGQMFAVTPTLSNHAEQVMCYDLTSIGAKAFHQGDRAKEPSCSLKGVKGYGMGRH